MHVTDLDKLAGIALSRLGVAPNTFYEMTFKELQCALDDHDAREADVVKVQIEANKRTIWEATRWQTMYVFNSNAPRKHQIKDPKRLGKFEWEKGLLCKEGQQTIEEMKHVMYAIAGKAYLPKKEKR